MVYPNVERTLSQRGLEQRQIAGLLGISRSMVCCALKGRRNSKRLCRFLPLLVDKPSDWLFQRRASPQ